VSYFVRPGSLVNTSWGPSPQTPLPLSGWSVGAGLGRAGVCSSGCLVNTSWGPGHASRGARPPCCVPRPPVAVRLVGRSGPGRRARLLAPRAIGALTQAGLTVILIRAKSVVGRATRLPSPRHGTRSALPHSWASQSITGENKTGMTRTTRSGPTVSPHR